MSESDLINLSEKLRLLGSPGKVEEKVFGQPMELSKNRAQEHTYRNIVLSV